MKDFSLCLSLYLQHLTPGLLADVDSFLEAVLAFIILCAPNELNRCVYWQHKEPSG